MPAMTSTSAMTGAGLKKCMPTTRPGSAAALAIAVIGIEEVLEASTALGATALSAAKSSRLSSRRSGAASMTSPASASASSVGRAGDLAGLALQPALGPPALQAVGDLGQAALARLGHRVVQQRARARRGGELRDPGAHGPGADDADDLGHLAHAEGN